MNRWRIRPVVAVAALTALAVLTVAATTTFLLWNLRIKELAHARGETVSLSHILAEQTTRTLQNVDLVLQNTESALAEEIGTGAPVTGNAIHELLVGRLSGMHQIRSMFVVDARGEVMNSSRRFPGDRYSVADREYFTVHRRNPGTGLYVGAPIRGRNTGLWTLPMSRRIDGPGGEFRGVLAVVLDLGYFETLYKSISFDGLSPIALYLTDGTLVASQSHEETAIGTVVAITPSSWTKGGESRTQQETTPSGEQRIATYHRVPEYPLMVGVGISQEIVLGHWQEKARVILIGALCIIVLVVVAAWALARELRKEEVLSRELAESGERLRLTIAAAMDAIVIVDAHHGIILFNPAAEKMFGCGAADAIGTRLERFLAEHSRAAFRRHLEGFSASGAAAPPPALPMEIAGLRLDGQEFPIESTVSVVQLHGETLYTAILRDVTERTLAQEKLLESNRQLRELSSSLQRVREEERTRISRELHDELGQQLTGLKMDLSWLANRLHDEPGELARKTGAMKQQVDATIKSVRRLSTELRPTLLDDLGLGAAIEWLATDFSHKTGVTVALDLAGEKNARGDALVTALFRIVQECLTNVAKHAQATQVSVTLRQAGNALELEVADDGKGMADPGRAKNGSHGLVGIRERAMMLGAAAAFTSSPGAGMQVRVVVPLDTAMGSAA